MRAILKYKLDITDLQFVGMPSGAKPLTAQFQGDDLVVWALVNTELGLEPRKFLIFGTFNPVSEEGAYLATVQDPSRPLVWHVFWS